MEDLSNQGGVGTRLWTALTGPSVLQPVLLCPQAVSSMVFRSLCPAFSIVLKKPCLCWELLRLDCQGQADGGPAVVSLRQDLHSWGHGDPGTRCSSWGWRMYTGSLGSESYRLVGGFSDTTIARKWPAFNSVFLRKGKLTKSPCGGGSHSLRLLSHSAEQPWDCRGGCRGPIPPGPRPHTWPSHLAPPH
jgi:hypothetical protein